MWELHVLTSFSLSHHQAAVTTTYRGKPCVPMYTEVKIITELWVLWSTSKVCHHHLDRHIGIIKTTKNGYKFEILKSLLFKKAGWWWCQLYVYITSSVRTRKVLVINFCWTLHVIEEKIEGGTGVMGRRGRRHKYLLDNLKENRGYWKLKEEALHCTLWSTGFGKGHGSVVWQTREEKRTTHKTN